MIIYSEILGKPFNSVEDCLTAEEQYNKKLKEEESRKQKERELIEKAVNDTYETLIHAWMNHLKALDLAGYDMNAMENKTLVFVEVVLDADDRQAENLKS